MRVAGSLLLIVTVQNSKIQIITGSAHDVPNLMLVSLIKNDVMFP